MGHLVTDFARMCVELQVVLGGTLLLGLRVGCIL